MHVIPWGLLPFLSCTGFALAQEPEEPEPPAFEGDPFALIERDDKLIDLQWRRNADGRLEWAIAGDQAKWRPLFDDSLANAFRVGGLASFVVPLLHNGDLLSLTDGEGHLRRLQLPTDTAALAAFARGTPSARVEELDRLVAVDVLRSRADDAAKTALARLVDDASAPAAVRARAALAPVVRERLGQGE